MSVSGNKNFSMDRTLLIDTDTEMVDHAFRSIIFNVLALFL